MVGLGELVLDSVGINEKISGGAFETVSMAYATCTGRRFWKAKHSAKIEQACQEFSRLQFLFKISLTALMHEAVNLYGQEWCLDVFKSKWPPFNVVTSEKCRKRLIHNHRPKVAQTAESITIQAREMSINLVTVMGKAGALSIVQEGWPTDARLRAAMLLKIKEMNHG